MATNIQSLIDEAEALSRMPEETATTTIPTTPSRSPNVYEDETTAAEDILKQMQAGRLFGAGSEKLPAASIPERFFARAMFDEDAKRRLYLAARGKLSTEPGTGIWGVSGRENIADVVESSSPWLKAGAQTLGELGGTVMGGIPGRIVGGGLGRAGAQDIIETLANITGHGIQNSRARVLREALTGAATTSIGTLMAMLPGAAVKAAPYLGKIPGVSKLSDKLVTALKDNVLTNISQFQPGMAEFARKLVPGKWKTLFSLLPVAARRLTDVVRQKVLPGIQQFKRTSGDKLRLTRDPIINDSNNKINFMFVKDKIREVYDRFAGPMGMDAEEKTMFQRLANIFVKPGEDVTEIPLKRAYRLLKFIDKDLRKTWMPAGKLKFPRSDAYTAALKGLRGVVKGAIHEEYPIIKGAEELFDMEQQWLSRAVDYFGSEKKALNFIRTGLFDESAQTDLPRQTFDLINAALPDDMKFGYDSRLYGMADFLNTAKVTTSGLKFGLVPMATGAVTGGLVGAGTAALTPGQPGESLGGRMARSAAIGGLTGGALAQGARLAQYPFSTPKGAVSMMARLQGLSEVSPVIQSRIAQIYSDMTGLAAKAPFFTNPISDAIENVEEKFGITVTKDDLKLLKTKRLEAMKQ